MVYFRTKNTNLGKVWRALEWKLLVYFMTIWNILRSFGICSLWPFGLVCGHLVYFSPFWFVWTKKKSGNPVFKAGSSGDPRPR
jgi:hypothetical protein